MKQNVLSSFGENANESESFTRIVNNQPMYVYFDVDEKFDRWFLELLATGDTDRILREVTIEKMIAAGDGGTVELLAWLVAMGAAGKRKAETMFYVPSVPLRCGMGGVAWPL